MTLFNVCTVMFWLFCFKFYVLYGIFDSYAKYFFGKQPSSIDNLDMCLQLVRNLARGYFCHIWLLLRDLLFHFKKRPLYSIKGFLCYERKWRLPSKIWQYFFSFKSTAEGRSLFNAEKSSLTNKANLSDWSEICSAFIFSAAHFI